jgi:hypothetical protein
MTLKTLEIMTLIKDIIDATIFPGQKDDVTQTLCFAGRRGIPSPLASFAIGLACPFLVTLHSRMYDWSSNVPSSAL